LALVDLSAVEQRYRAVIAVLDGASVTEVAAEVGVSRQSVHAWLARYRREGLGGLVDRSHRPQACPHRTPTDVEVLVCELRRAHPGWGALRIRLELALLVTPPEPMPSRASVNRILVRHGLLVPRARRRKRSDYVRWERPGPMQLWQMDIVSGLMLVDDETGELREVKIVTGVDDHSRYCVIAKAVERATGRAVCAALSDALVRFGAPEEILTDNGKQFTARFGNGGEVLFDRICRRNAIAHRLTKPKSPTTTGKVERFHQTLRREFLDHAGPYRSLTEAQAALDAWVEAYNSERPHQSLDTRTPVRPAERFEPVPACERESLELWLPPSLVPSETGRDPVEPVVPATWAGGPVEFDRVVPASGNLCVMGRQYWLGPARAGLTVRFWADPDLIHLSIAGARVKTVRSHLSVSDLAQLVGGGAVPAGPSPLPAFADCEAVEVDRVVSNCGVVSLANRPVTAAEILRGRQVAIRIEESVLMFFDPSTRELLRTRPNPLSRDQVRTLRGARPAGPPPRPSTKPVVVQRRASDTGCICVCRQIVALGRHNAHRTVTVHVSESVLAIELGDEGTRTIRRTTSLPVRNVKADRPYKAKALS
jgi:transposase InsO family protein